MDELIQISKLNDFIFCPYSLYLHTIYDNFSKDVYHETSQTIGSIKHEKIDQKRYSTSKNILQGTPIYSEKYHLVGKIDLFDTEKHQLIERKFKIKKIYDGYRYQLYAQYFCLIEMNYKVNSLFLHSLSDNKRYRIPIPNNNDINEFESLIERISNFDVHCAKAVASKKKCQRCVYHELCDISKC